MLANELFLRNKNSNKRIVRNRFPIKKIFLDNNQGKVDLMKIVLIIMILL